MTDGDLDPSQFEFKSEFITDIPTEDALGTWAGWAMYAEATSDVKAHFSRSFPFGFSVKMNLPLPFGYVVIQWGNVPINRLGSYIV